MLKPATFKQTYSAFILQQPTRLLTSSLAITTLPVSSSLSSSRSSFLPTIFSAERILYLKRDPSILGRADCFSGWTEEYSGYLLAGHHNHEKSTDYTCIDSNPEAVQGKSLDENGRLLYPVEAYCKDASLSCPPYVDGRELACVVCTK